MACALPVIATYEPGNRLDGLVTIERDIKQIVERIVFTINNYDMIKETVLETAKEHSFENITKNLLSQYNKILKNKSKMKEQLMDIYENTKISINTNPRSPTSTNGKINLTFIFSYLIK